VKLTSASIVCLRDLTTHIAIRWTLCELLWTHLGLAYIWGEFVIVSPWEAVQVEGVQFIWSSANCCACGCSVPWVRYDIPGVFQRSGFHRSSQLDQHGSFPIMALPSPSSSWHHCALWRASEWCEGFYLVGLRGTRKEGGSLLYPSLPGEWGHIFEFECLKEVSINRAHKCSYLHTVNS